MLNFYNSLTIGQDKKLEKLNERAIRLVCNDYDSPYDDLLLKTGKRMSYVTRKINLAELVYKVLYDMAPPVENPFFTRQVTPYDIRDNFKLKNTIQSNLACVQLLSRSSGAECVTYQCKEHN